LPGEFEHEEPSDIDAAGVLSQLSSKPDRRLPLLKKQCDQTICSLINTNNSRKVNTYALFPFPGFG
jgi:hypothetical protein